MWGTEFCGKRIRVFVLILHSAQNTHLVLLQVLDVLSALAHLLFHCVFRCRELDIFIFQPITDQHELRRVCLLDCPCPASHLHAAIDGHHSLLPSKYNQPRDRLYRWVQRRERGCCGCFLVLFLCSFQATFSSSLLLVRSAAARSHNTGAPLAFARHDV